MNGTAVATLGALAIPDAAPQLLRVDCSSVLSPGDTFDSFQIVARDSNGSANNNFFTLQEVAAAVGTPEPVSFAIWVLMSAALCGYGRARLRPKM